MKLEKREVVREEDVVLEITKKEYIDITAEVIGDRIRKLEKEGAGLPLEIAMLFALIQAEITGKLFDGSEE